MLPQPKIYSPNLCWSEDLRSQIQELDAQHEQLLELWQSLYDAACGEAPHYELMHCLQELHDYMEYHFSREESLMELSCYPDAEEHKTLHREKIATLLTLTVVARGEGLTMEHINSMALWVEEHIQTADKDLAVFFKNGS